MRRVGKSNSLSSAGMKYAEECSFFLLQRVKQQGSIVFHVCMDYGQHNIHNGIYISNIPNCCSNYTWG